MRVRYETDEFALHEQVVEGRSVGARLSGPDNLAVGTRMQRLCADSYRGVCVLLRASNLTLTLALKTGLRALVSRCACVHVCLHACRPAHGCALTQNFHGELNLTYN